jgi:hypothetical protein
MEQMIDPPNDLQMKSKLMCAHDFRREDPINGGLHRGASSVIRGEEHDLDWFSGCQIDILLFFHEIFFLDII